MVRILRRVVSEPKNDSPGKPPESLVVMNEDPLGNNPHPRMTLTFTGISRARLVLVTVEGDEKRDALRRVMNGDDTAPAAHIRADRVVWLADPAAAADL